jgi:hypothetical protein
MDLLATMIVTGISDRGNGTIPALVSMPIVNLAECRRSMSAYIDDMPDTEVTGRGENYIVGKIKTDNGAIVTFYVKCQTRGKS